MPSHSSFDPFADGFLILIAHADPDAPIQPHLCRDLAASRKFALAEASSEAQACEQLRRRHPELVILTGFATGPRLRAFVRDLRNADSELPIFLVTDSCDLRTESEALECGVDAVFSALEDCAALVVNAEAVCAQARQPCWRHYPGRRADNASSNLVTWGRCKSC